jgi:hypothetical protein
MKKLVCGFLLWIVVHSHNTNSFAQSSQYLADKPGKFIFNNQLDKCAGIDVTTLNKNFSAIVEWVRLNDSVLGHPTGFDSLVGFTAYCFDGKSKIEDYGIRGSIGIAFHHFYIENGDSD